MQQCVILTKDDYDSIMCRLHDALIDIKEVGETYPCYRIGRIGQRVREAYDVLMEED
jgi:hypothetical protein